MFLNPKDGSIFIKKDLQLFPFSDITHLKHQNTNKTIEINNLAGGWTIIRFKSLIIMKSYVNLNLTYLNDLLESISFTVSSSKEKNKPNNSSWENWNEDDEQKKVLEFNLWLDKNVSNEREFDWGKINVYYDPRSASSSISVKFDKTNLSLATLKKRSEKITPSITVNTPITVNNNLKRRTFTRFSTLRTKAPKLRKKPKDWIRHSIYLRLVKKVENIEKTHQYIEEIFETHLNRSFNTNPTHQKDPNSKWYYVNSIYNIDEKYKDEKHCHLIFLPSFDIFYYLKSLVTDVTDLDFLKKLDGRDLFGKYDDTIFDPKEIISFITQMESKKIYDPELDLIKTKCEEAINKNCFLKGMMYLPE